MIEKSPILDAIKTHFRALQHQHIAIEEWDTEVYFNPLTLEERAAVDTAGHEFLLDIVILKSLDADGKKIFTKADKPELMIAASPAIIARLANAICNADRADVATLKKSLAPKKEPN